MQREARGSAGRSCQGYGLGRSRALLWGALAPAAVRKRAALFALATTASALPGCSPTAFWLRERDAERSLSGAERVQAERYAPYELVLARLYLDKAREESAEAHYAEALRLLEGCAQTSERARSLAQARGAGAPR